MDTPTHTTPFGRIHELEHCVRRMAAIPRHMKVCAEKIEEPERAAYIKACEYTERELERAAEIYGVDVRS